MSEQTPKPAPGIVFTISAVLDGFPISVAFDTSRADVHQVLGRLQDLGCTPPTVSTPAAAQAAGDEPPLNAPPAVREAWNKKVPFGKRQGEKLGIQTDKELTYLATECRMEDIKAAAKKILAYRLEL